ncbi:MAG: division/cell wall cluster transcriptional repressor MraZ, partial [Candidatus Omnitrophica bacterium]|nr:division/cell wall cluster transcriptional repressor MraZ [Candidatus Omnitrophota bacterium]
IIPSRFREVITDRGIEMLYITRGLDACLFVFGEKEWRTQENKFKTMAFTKRDVRAFQRQFFGGAVEVEPDKQWRILIPDYLKEYAGLKHNIKLVGVSDRFEIWDKEKWNDFYSNSKEKFEDIAEDLILSSEEKSA